MKRFLILLTVLCLSLSVIAFASCGGNNTDTSSNTSSDTSSDTASDKVSDTDSDKVTDEIKDVTYVITLTDQESTVIVGAKLFIVDSYDETIVELTTNEKGQATVTLPSDDVYFVNIVELPEWHLNTQGKVKLENEDTAITIQNNTPNGTEARPYPVEDLNDVTLGAGEIVYFISYGGGRNLLVENAQGLKLTYGSEEPLEPDEENKIYYKMPSIDDANDRARLIKLENVSSEEKSYKLTFYSDKGAFDNPYNVVLDQLEKITVLKDTTVYYMYKATKSGMVMVYSETESNNIYCYNMTTSAASEYTNGAVCEYIYANEGDEVMIYVASNASSNYNKVEFKVSHFAGTEKEPIPLYKDVASFKLTPSQALTFTVNREAKHSLTVEGPSYKLTLNGTEYTQEDTYEIIIEGETVFTVANTDAYDAQGVTITFDALNEDLGNS